MLYLEKLVQGPVKTQKLKNNSNRRICRSQAKIQPQSNDQTESFRFFGICWRQRAETQLEVIWNKNLVRWLIFLHSLCRLIPLVSLRICKNFKDPITGVHINNIEAMWDKPKKNLKLWTVLLITGFLLILTNLFGDNVLGALRLFLTTSLNELKLISKLCFSGRNVVSYLLLSVQIIVPNR